MKHGAETIPMTSLLARRFVLGQPGEYERKQVGRVFTLLQNFIGPAFLVVWLLAAASLAPAAVITVTRSDDSGPGTLRQAILSANDSSEPVEIRFAIGSGPVSLSPTTSLPLIANQVTIDGTTQPGYSGSPLITLSGGGTVAEGLRIRARRCIVRGLVIQNFAGDGVLLDGGGDHVVQDNFIGTDSAGAVANGNAAAGVHVLNSSGNSIGRTVADLGNLISGNGIGVHIEGAMSSGNVVQANSIGTTRSGTAPLANTLAGVVLSGSASGNQIGGTDSGASNRIAFNFGDGVQVSGAGTTGNLIERNAIFINGGLGINLQGGVEDSFGVTDNDGTDGDTGPNNLQNFPEITSLSVASGSTIVRGTLKSRASTFFRINIYRSGTKDSSANGEGENFCGSATVGTDLGGFATFSVPVPGTYPYEWFSATATDLSTSDTSEFSATLQANPGTLQFSKLTYTAEEDAGVGALTVERVGGSYGTVTVDAATSTRFEDKWAKEALGCGGDADYVRASGTLTFADGDTTAKDIFVSICNDTRLEGDEVLNVTLSNTTGGAALDEIKKQATLFILDDENALSISDTSVTDDVCPYSSIAVFIVSLPKAITRDVSVHYATREGTAKDGVDYVGTSGTLTIPRGATSARIEVTVNCDTIPEGVEQFYVDLTDPVNARLATTKGMCSISDLRLVRVCCYRQNQIRFSFYSAAGGLYRMDYARDFGPNSNWVPVPGAEFIQGDGQLMEVIDADTSNRPQSFYRLVLLQQPGQFQ